jgi:hypothetical protein
MLPVVHIVLEKEYRQVSWEKCHHQEGTDWGKNWEEAHYQQAKEENIWDELLVNEILRGSCRCS